MADNRKTTQQETADLTAKAERLFSEHHPYIRSTIAHFVRDPDECEDIFQDVFVFFVRKPVPADIVHIKSYLHRVILDRIRDRKRSQACYRRHLDVYAQQRPGRQESPVEPVLAKAQAQEVFDLLDAHLKKNEAEAILHCYRDGVGVDEAARRMDVKSRSVARYVSVGLKKIRNIVRKDLER